VAVELGHSALKDGGPLTTGGGVGGAHRERDAAGGVEAHGVRTSAAITNSTARSSMAAKITPGAACTVQGPSTRSCESLGRPWCHPEAPAGTTQSAAGLGQQRTQL